LVVGVILAGLCGDGVCGGKKSTNDEASSSSSNTPPTPIDNSSNLRNVPSPSPVQTTLIPPATTPPPTFHPSGTPQATTGRIPTTAPPTLLVPVAQPAAPPTSNSVTVSSYTLDAINREGRLVCGVDDVTILSDNVGFSVDLVRCISLNSRK
jgi:hypothetical protein